MSDDYEKDLQMSARGWFDAAEEIRSAEEDLQRAKKSLERGMERLSSFDKILRDSVHPLCGSATKPHRRIFLFEDTHGATRMVVVNHDHGSGARGGVTVTVEKPQ